MKKPSIPELPKTAKELEELLKKTFKILWESSLLPSQDGEGRPGDISTTTITTNLELECPLCGMRFNGIRKSGCFMNVITPDICPNCCFPHNVNAALMNKAAAKKKKDLLIEEKDARKCEHCNGSGKVGVQDCLFCNGKGYK